MVNLADPPVGGLLSTNEYARYRKLIAGGVRKIWSESALEPF